jgi:hypothetical protein
MKNATVGSGTRTKFGQLSGFLHLLLTEYRRAIAADVLYDDLKRRNAAARTREGIACSDIPRRVFDELYSSGGQVSAAAQPSGARHAERPKTSAIEPATAA